MSSTPQPMTPVIRKPGNNARWPSDARRIPHEEEFSQRSQDDLLREYPFRGCALEELIVYAVILRARCTKDYSSVVGELANLKEDTKSILVVRLQAHLSTRAMYQPRLRPSGHAVSTPKAREE